MKANELRIGNWVMGDLKKPYQFELSDFSDWYNEHNSHEFGNYIYPIPLTEEWLLKFGFKKADKKLDIYPESFILDNIMESRLYLRPSYQGGYYWGFLTESFIDGGYEKDHEFYDNRPMLYVHQLQNLYFALTGEELTIL